MTEATIPVLSNRIANCTEQYRDFLRFFNIFFTGRKKKIRVGTKIVGRVRLPEPHNFFVLALRVNKWNFCPLINIIMYY